MTAAADLDAGALDRKARRWVWLSLTLVVALALGAVTATGGLQPVAGIVGPSSMGLAVDTAVDVGAASIAVRRVIVQDLPGPQDPDFPNAHLLGVVTLITVTDDSTWSGARDAVVLDGVAHLRYPESTSSLLRQNTTLSELQPGLPEEVVFVWTQSGPVPASVTVVLQCERRVQDEETAKHLWDDRAPCARGVFPVIDRTTPPSATARPS